jgi:hypothetical protein
MNIFFSTLRFKKHQILLILIWIGASITSFAQVPEDVLRFSWNPHNGTARNMAIGGVMGSLGGDITAAFVNPAGIGFFKTNEFVLTPGMSFIKNEALFRDQHNSSKKNSFNFGPSGIIWGFPSSEQPKNSSAISLAFTQTANYNNQINYSALNNYSSFSEQFAEEFAKSYLSINDVLNTNSPLPYTAAPALYTYLMDTVTINGVTQVKTAPEFLLDSGIALLQEMKKSTRGGLYEFAFTYAANIKDKLMYGITIGVPIVNYRSTTNFTESDISGDTANGFQSFNYINNFKTTGAGFNAKMGVIFRPREYIRIGAAIHTPSIFTLTDTRTTELTTQLESPAYSSNVSSKYFSNNQPGISDYAFRTPWKFIISGAYVFREVENVKKQKGFISADIEYVSHRASRFSSAKEEPTQSEINYYNELKGVIKNEYNRCFNFRVGGELKFDVIMARLGFAYYSNPYKDIAFKASQMLLSGGLGYRNNGFFIDVTYTYNVKKDVDLPYRLSDRANTFSSLKQQTANVITTFGIKF